MIVKCKVHKAGHPKELVDDFKLQCRRLKLRIPRKSCPIEVVMESKRTLNLLEPEYTIINKSADSIKKWPTNIDIMITKFPAIEKEGFSRGLAGFIANQTYQRMNSNSLAYVLTSSLKEDKTRPFKIVEMFVSAGFKFIDTIVWMKNKFTPTQGSKRVNNVYDFIFMFSKGENYHLDRSTISYLKNQFEPEGDDNYLCAGNVWRIKVSDKDITPEELIDCCIKLSNLLPNSKIVDPFMDHGSVLSSALKHGHSFWGCEADKINFKKCKKVVKEYRRKK